MSKKETLEETITRLTKESAKVITVQYEGYRYDDNKKSYYYREIETDKKMCFASPFKMLNKGYRLPPIGAGLKMFVNEDGTYKGVMCFCDKIDSDADQETRLRWTTLQKADESVKRNKNKMANEWKENLHPIKMAYIGAGWEKRQHILAMLIRHITS